MNEERHAPQPPPLLDRSKGFRIPAGSEWAKEEAKFQQWPTDYAPTPGNPYQFRPFPQMVYKAADWMGKISCHAVVGPQWEFKTIEEYRRAEMSAEDFTKTCQRVVKNDEELQKAHEAGYRDDPVKAVAFAQAREDSISRGAAERHTTDLKMSEPAQREAAAADEETAEHLPEIPVRRRGRPKGSKNKVKT